MTFPESLWDNSDPTYSPCTTAARDKFYWRAPRKYVKRGYELRSSRLEGVKGDGQDLKRAQQARKLTREMLAWFEVNDSGLSVGSLEWLASRYLTDEISPFTELKASSVRKYIDQMNYWSTTHGTTALSAVNYRSIMSWKKDMQSAGRSVDWISRAFRHLRILINYGVVIEDPDCVRVSVILSKIRFAAPKARQTAPTEDQVLAVIDAAERSGSTAFALGIQIQWWFHLRPVDVRGQYLPIKGNDRGGVVKGNMRWQDGLEWTMFNRELTTFTKFASKTERHGSEAINADLTLVPELRAKLLSVPCQKRVGPVIVKPSTGLPYTPDEWARLWRTYADIAGVPQNVKCMDTRAGATTHGSQKGATRTQLKNAAGHKSENTTERYMRGRSTGLNSVVKLRREQ